MTKLFPLATFTLVCFECWSIFLRNADSIKLVSCIYDAHALDSCDTNNNRNTNKKKAEIEIEYISNHLVHEFGKEL